MKLVVISDTHQQHAQFPPLSGDVLLHCGDMFNLFRQGGPGLSDIDDWFGRQDFELVLCTGGNHDIELEEALARNPQPFKNAVYLQDSGYEHGGKRFWGAPWVPDLSSHAFFASGRTLAQRWASICSGWCMRTCAARSSSTRTTGA